LQTLQLPISFFLLRRVLQPKHPMSFEASKAVFNGGSEADDGSTIFVQKLEASDAPVVVGRIAVDSDVINGGKQDGSNVLTQNFEASEGVINGGSEAEGDDGSAVFVQKILAFLEVRIFLPRCIQVTRSYSLCRTHFPV